jgi:hypothetical protein
MDAVTNLETATQPDWDVLIDAVRNGRCTPFVGAGASEPHLPRGAELARQLAAADGYPFDDVWNLPRVTQYIATTKSPALVKQRVIDILAERQRTAASPDVHRLLAGLRQPLYITTNYDELLERALGAGSTTTTCRWNDRLERRLGPYKKIHPTAATPDVFHLHGDLTDLHSLLLTEDDYIDFTVSLARRSESSRNREGVIPHRIREALADTALLFVGYSLNDWNFRVLMRYIVKTLALTAPELSESVSIQLEPDDLSGEERERAKRFLARYLSDSSAVTVHWCDATEFLSGLTSRLGGGGP